MLARVWWLLLLASCVESQLVPCGDASCPVGDVCVAGRCATTDQLEACAQLADDDPCTLTSGTVGRCLLGICTPVGCGNFVVDPGEVCDDGNVTSLDGCSGTCDSDETCGNGVLDVVTGESCDCGRDAPTQPATCAELNSVDPTTACTPDCKLRRCGDDMIGGSEQCDGTAPITAACTSFGYYGGDVGCSSLCQLDVSACTGRCGDDVVDLAYETCDGTPPDNQSCLDFGFDLGPLGCSGVCTPGLVDCDRLGWSRADLTVARATQVWAGSSRRIMLFTDGSVVVDDNGTRSVQAGPFSAIAGTPTTLYAVGASVAKAYVAGTWTDVSIAAVPWGASAPATAWASATLGLFVAVPASVVAHHFTTGTGLWSTHVVPAFAAPRFGGSRTKAYLIDPGGPQVLVWRSSVNDFVDPAFTFPLGVTTIFDIAEGGAAPYVATGDDLYAGNVGGSVWLQVGIPASRVQTNSLGGVDVLLANKLQRIGTGAFGPISTPPGSVALAEDAGRSYVAGSAAGVFALDRGVWTDVPAPPAAARYARVRSYKASGLSVSGAYAAHANGLTSAWTSVPVLGGTRDTIHGVQPADGFLQISAFEAGLQYVPTSGPSQIADLSSVDPRALWRGGNLVFAAGLGGVATIDVSTRSLAEVAISGVDFAAVHGLTASNVYAAGALGGAGVIHHYDGTVWTAVDTTPELAMVPLTGVFVTPSQHVYAVGGEYIYRYGPSAQDPSIKAWSHWRVPGATFAAVAGSSDTDLWFVGKADFGFAVSGLHHWDGQALYPVRLPRAGVAHDLFVEAGRLCVLLADESTGIDTIVSLARVTTW